MTTTTNTLQVSVLNGSRFLSTDRVHIQDRDPVVHALLTRYVPVFRSQGVDLSSVVTLGRVEVSRDILVISGDDTDIVSS